MPINLETLVPYDQILNSQEGVFELVDRHGSVVLIRNDAPAYVIMKSDTVFESTPPEMAEQENKAMNTLHEAMKLVLLDADDNQMHAADLADTIYKRGLYYKKDGSKAGPEQIRARCNRYPELFVALKGNFITLNTGEETEAMSVETKAPGVSKFVGLERYLDSQNEETLSLSFEEIERITGEKLYPSAYKYSAYWHPSDTHVLPNLILECGYEISRVDLKNQTIHLTRIAR
jgi:hypothetical protein